MAYTHILQRGASPGDLKNKRKEKKKEKEKVKNSETARTIQNQEWFTSLGEKIHRDIFS